MDTCNNLRGDIYIKSVAQQKQPSQPHSGTYTVTKSIPGLKLANYQKFQIPRLQILLLASVTALYSKYIQWGLVQTNKN